MAEPNHDSQSHTGLPALTASEHSPVTDEAPPTSSTSALVHVPYDLSGDEDVNSIEGYAYDGNTTYDYDYNSSSSSTEDSNESGILAHYVEDENHPQRNSRTSSHSSVSSIPASVLAHSHNASGKSTVRRHEQHHQKSHRHREGAFWKPSSPRAIQMNTEDERDEYSTPPRRRGVGARVSDISSRSAGSTPVKRLSGFSSRKSAGKQGVQTEYPLVLLHCTLLPPSLPVAGFTGRPNPKILKDVLPRKYWRRWKILEEKVGSGVLRDRGVLVSHPQDSYDLLEERLLESLELQRPRLHHGHFLSQEEYDSDKEGTHQEESGTDDEQGDVCPDCGGRVVTCDNQNRKWDVRIFAANGLMRAGAWAAAWREMEKVDVEVALWLPTDVRRELEKRLMEDELVNREDGIPQWNAPSGKAADLHTSGPTSVRNSVDSVKDAPLCPELFSSSIPEPAPQEPEHKQVPPAWNHKPTAEIDLRTLLVNYIRVLVCDGRNIAITLLSVMVAFFAFSGARSASPVPEVQPSPQDILGSASSAVGLSQYPSVNSQPLSAQSGDMTWGIASVASSIPTFGIPSSDVPLVSATDELQAVSSEAVEPELSTTSAEVPADSMSTATATASEHPAEESLADSMPTEHSEASTQTEETTTTAVPATIQDPPEPSQSPTTSTAKLEANDAISLDGTEPVCKVPKPGNEKEILETQSDETTEFGTEETTLQD